MKKYQGRKFIKSQLILVVEIMIASVFDTIQDSFEARWMDGRHDEEWKKHNDDAKSNINANQHVWSLIQNLGWNLSTFVAQVTGEGMGNADALDIPMPHRLSHLNTIIERWAEDWIAGKRGINVNTETHEKTYDMPNTTELAEAWVLRAFADYLA